MYIYIYISIQPYELVALSLINNAVETMLHNIVGPTMLLTHDNKVVQALFMQATTL